MSIFSRFIIFLRSGWFSWIEKDRLAACRYPKRASRIAFLRRQGITLLVNLHTEAHSFKRLTGTGLREVHIPVRDFTAPTPADLRRGIDAITSELARGGRVAVHCGAGLGRTGTLLACYFVERGMTPEAAITHVRQLRYGSIETKSQLEAIRAFRPGRPSP